MKILFIVLFISSAVFGQTIGSGVPKEISKSGNYLFYLHGGVVTTLGNNAINQSAPEWGPYEYLNILDSLRTRGFNVISENRREGVDDSVYVNKILKQIDTLYRSGVNPKNLILIGASAGSNIVIHVAARLKNEKMKYVIMGGCWPDTHKNYQALELRGNFLSIIEASDPHGSCFRIFDHRKSLSGYQEITLNTGLSHGFLYKGHKAWIDPVIRWFNPQHK